MEEGPGRPILNTPYLSHPQCWHLPWSSQGHKQDGLRGIQSPSGASLLQSCLRHRGPGLPEPTALWSRARSKGRKGRSDTERTQAVEPRGLNMQDYTLIKTNEPLCEMLKQDK